MISAEHYWGKLPEPVNPPLPSRKPQEGCPRRAQVLEGGCILYHLHIESRDGGENSEPKRKTWSHGYLFA